MKNSTAISARYIEAKRVFLTVRELGLDRREEALDAACAGDTDLRALVLELLEGQEAPLPFESLAEDIRAAHERIGDTVDASRGTRIGPYHLLQRIGEGGFGVVYMAEQTEPVSRRVALKVIKLGMDTRQVIARFEAERQALAMMDHPNIARVLDAGSTSTGRPYFVMELVRGVPITEYCDTHGLGTERRLRLFVDVCHAVQHAHFKGVIHRDIKPTNVLVTLYDGKPVPKVIDFGVAKATNFRLTERTLFTEHGQVIGTPEYMSPEQAEMSGLDVDARTDIYSLGVLLYELLTGTTPHDSERLRSVAYGEMHRIIREEAAERPSLRVHTLGSPVRSRRRTPTPRTPGSIDQIASQRHTDPTSLCRMLRGDLDWIVTRALEQDRSRRYDTAGHLADEIERHLRGEAVSAGPPTTRYQLAKLIRRHRGAFYATLAVAAVLVVGIIGTSTALAWALKERSDATSARNLAIANETDAKDARDAAIESEHIARLEAFEALVISAGQTKRDGKYFETQALLDQVNPKDRNHWWSIARALCSTRQTDIADSGRFKWNADRSLASIISANGAEVRDGRTLEVLRRLEAPEGISFQRLRWTTDPDRFVLTSDGSKAQLYDATTLRPLGPKVQTDSVPMVYGDSIIVTRVAMDGRIQNVSYDMLTGRAVASWDIDEHLRARGTTGQGDSSPTMRWAVADPLPDGTVQVASLPNFERRFTIDERTPRVAREFSERDQLVFRVDGGIVECWWISEDGEPAFGWARAFDGSPKAFGTADGVVSVIDERTVYFLDPRDGTRLVAPLDNGAGFGVVDWKRQRYVNHRRATGPKLIDLRDWSWPHSTRVAQTSCNLMEISDTARLAAIANFDGHFLDAPDCLRLIEPESGLAIARLLPANAIVRGLAFSHRGDLLAIGIALDPEKDLRRKRVVRVLSMRSGRVLWEREIARPPRLGGFSLDDELLHYNGATVDARTGEPAGDLPLDQGELLLSPDRRTAVIGEGRRSSAFDMETGGVLDEFGNEPYQGSRAFAFSADSRWISLPMAADSVRIYDLQGERPMRSLPSEITRVNATAWSPDGSVLATGGHDRFIRLWDAESLRLLGVLAGHESYVRALRFSPDGKTLYSCSGDGTFRVWNTRTPWEQVEFVHRRRAIADDIRPAIRAIARASTDEQADDAWRALEELGYTGEKAELAELLLIGELLTLHGSP